MTELLPPKKEPAHGQTPLVKSYVASRTFLASSSFCSCRFACLSSSSLARTSSRRRLIWSSTTSTGVFFFHGFLVGWVVVTAVVPVQVPARALAPPLLASYAAPF